MRKIYIFALAAALLALAGCERGMAPEGAGGITVQASIGTMTKVSYDGASTSFTAGDRIAVYAWTGSAAQVPTKRVVNGEVNTFDGTAWTPAKPMEWDGLKAAHYFLGISPVAAVTDFTADPYTLDPSKYTDSDLLIATSLDGITPSAAPVDLTFTHAMAKLNVNLKFRSEFGGTPTVTGVTVKAKKTATVNYLTKAVTATGDASEVDIPATATAATGYALGFSGLQVPQSGVTTVTVTIAGKTYVYESATDIPLESGKYTTMGLVVGKDKVELGSVEVADWTAGTDLLGGEAVKVDMLHTPLTIEALEAGAVVNFDINTDAAVNAVQYRTFNGTAWTAWANYADDDPVTLTNIGDKVQFRGNNARYATDAIVNDHGSRFRFTADCLAYGNVMSLVDSEHFSILTTLTSDYAFTFLFSSNSHLKLDDSKPLRLPATQLSKCCYEFMFTLCTGLNTLPQLPATQLAGSCYSNMFWKCSGLTTIPEDYLPATTLADYCYSGMFDGCSSLTAAPILPATTLTQYCYQLMFKNCPKLSSVTCLATDISASFCLGQWLYNSGTADGCERKVYVDPSMLAVGTGNSDGEWNLANSGTDGKRWTLENVDYANLTSADIGKVLAADGNIYADATQAIAAGTEVRPVFAY